MNMFKPSKAKTIEEYIGMIDEPRKSDIIELDKFIRKVAPKLKPYFSYNMPGYGPFKYKSAKGDVIDWPLIALASQKNYISLYVCAADDKGYVAEKYKKELPKTSIGRSCIRFKKVDDIDLKIIERIIKEGIKTGFHP